MNLSMSRNIKLQHQIGFIKLVNIQYFFHTYEIVRRLQMYDLCGQEKTLIDFSIHRVVNIYQNDRLWLNQYNSRDPSVYILV